jgi:predicted nuclease of predicted toxin-antitoxin system
LAGTRGSSFGITNLNEISCRYGVATRIVEWLRTKGYEVTHLREEGLHRLSDEEIFKKAVSEKRIILTFDLDFGEIIALSGRKLVSVIVFRLRNTHTPYVIKRLEYVLKESSDLLKEGSIVIVEDTRHRVRELPIKR